MGVHLSGITIGLAMMKEIGATGTPRSYLALSASGSAELLGVTGLTLAGTVEVEINEASDPNPVSPTHPNPAPAVDFTMLSGGKLSIPTGPATATTATFTQPAAGSTVTVSVADTAGMTVGEHLTLSGGGDYEVTSVTDSTHVVLKNDGATGNAAAGATVAVGTIGPSPVDLAFSGDLLEAAGTLTLEIDQDGQAFVYVAGSIAFQRGDLLSVTTEKDSSQQTHTGLASTLEVGASGVTMFFGVGATLNSADHTIDTSSAMGLLVNNASFGLALMTPSAASTDLAATAASFFALKATGDVSLVGISGFTVSIQDVEIEVDQAKTAGGLAAPAVDFTQLPGGKLSVPTGPGAGAPTVDLDFSGSILEASGLVTLSIGSFVYLSGKVAFEKGPAVTNPTLSDATTATGSYSTLEIGASDVNVFVGLGGPYWVDSNGDGKIDATDTPASSGATGLALGDVDLALVLVKQAGSAVSYYALTASADSIALVGVPGLTLQATSVDVEVNGSSNATGPVIDFAATFPAVTGAGAHPAGLAIPGTTLRVASADRVIAASGVVTLGIADVSATAGVSFEETTGSDSAPEIEVAVTNLQITLGSFTLPTASGLFYISRAGVAGSIMVDGAHFSAGDSTNGFSITADLAVSFNTGAQPVNETFTLAGGGTDTLNVPGGPYFSATLTLPPTGSTTTTAAFTQPAVGGTVTVAVGDTSWMSVGEYLNVSAGGLLQVASITDSTHVVLRNQGNSGNAAPGASVASGAAVSFGALTINVLGSTYTLSGTFELEQVTVSGQKEIRIGAANVASSFHDSTLGVDVTLSGGSGGIILLPGGLAGSLSGTFSVDISALGGQAGSQVSLSFNSSGSPVNQTITVAGSSITVDAAARTWSLGLSNATVQFGDFLTLSGNFAFASNADGSTQYGATNVEIFFGDGPYRLADGTVNPDAIGILVTNGFVGAVSYGPGSFAIYAGGTASLVGIDGLTIAGTVTVKINQTGHVVTSTITLPDGADPATVQMPFTTSAPITELDVAGLQLTAGGIITIGQAPNVAPARFVEQPSGRVDVSIPSVSVSVSVPIDGVLTPVVAVSGDAKFSFGGGTGFQLQSLMVNGFSIIGPDGNLQTVSTTPPIPPPAPPTIELDSPFDGQNVSLDTLNANHYIDVLITDHSGSGLNVASITDGPNAPELTLSGAAAAGVVLNGQATQPDAVNNPNLFRYSFTGTFVASTSPVVVTFLADSFHDNNLNNNLGSSESFTVTASANPAAVPTVRLASPLNGTTIGIQTLQARPYLDITYSAGARAARSRPTRDPRSP